MDIKLMPDNYKNSKSAGKSVDLRAPKVDMEKIGQKVNSQVSAFSKWFYVLLVVVLALTGGLYAYRFMLNKDIQAVAEEISQLQTKRDLTVEKNFISLKKGIDTLKTILTNRIYPTQVFKMLEETTLSKVQLVDLNLDLEKNILQVKAQAASYGIMAQQIVVYEEDKRIASVNLDEVVLGNSGQVESNFELVLDSGFTHLVK